MVNRAKQKGTSFESAIKNYFIERGWPAAARITQKGARDEGDLRLSENVPLVLQSKCTPKWTPSGYVNDVEKQIANAIAEGGFCIVKRVGMADIGKQYVVTTVGRQMDLIERIWAPPPKPARKFKRA